MNPETTGRADDICLEAHSFREPLRHELKHGAVAHAEERHRQEQGPHRDTHRRHRAHECDADADSGKQHDQHQSDRQHGDAERRRPAEMLCQSRREERRHSVPELPAPAMPIASPWYSGGYQH